MGVTYGGTAILKTYFDNRNRHNNMIRNSLLSCFMSNTGHLMFAYTCHLMCAT